MLNYSPEIEKGLCLFLHSFVSCEHFVIYLSHLAQAISTPTLIGSLFEFLKSRHCFRGDKDVNHTELKSFLQVRSKNYFFIFRTTHKKRSESSELFLLVAEGGFEPPTFGL